MADKILKALDLVAERIVDRLRIEQASIANCLHPLTPFTVRPLASAPANLLCQPRWPSKRYHRPLCGRFITPRAPPSVEQGARFHREQVFSLTVLRNLSVWSYSGLRFIEASPTQKYAASRWRERAVRHPHQSPTKTPALAEIRVQCHARRRVETIGLANLPEDRIGERAEWSLIGQLEDNDDVQPGTKAPPRPSKAQSFPDRRRRTRVW